MRKPLILLAIASVAATVACNKTQIVQEAPSPDAITFRPLMSGMTKAEATTANLTDFYVLARYTSSGSIYFGDTHYTKALPNWITDEERNWPDNDAYLDFYAYAPAATGQISGHDSGDNYKSFTVTPSTTASEQADLIFAFTPSKNKSSSGTSGVSLTFRHAEAKVAMKVLNSNNNLEITVNGIAMANVKGSGTFEYSGENEDKLKFEDWTSSASPVAQYAHAVSSAVIPSTAVAAGEEMILVPQTLITAAGYSVSGEYPGACIKVSLKIKDKSNNTWLVGGESEFEEVLWPLGIIDWNPGMAYTYSVDLAGGGYKSVDPDPTDSKYDLVPAISGETPISFVGVTVDGWTSSVVPVGY